MRISVRQQLSLLLVLSAGVGLAVLAISVWVTNHNFVLNISANRLEITASLKAAQISFNLELMQTAAVFVTTRVVIQSTIANYNNGSDTSVDAFAAAHADLKATLGDVGALSNALVWQAEMFARNTSGPQGRYSVLNATGEGADQIVLPWRNPDGSEVTLGGNGTMSYPPMLYPNLTISELSNGTYIAEYNGVTLGQGSTLVLGPLLVNESLSLLSMTLPITNTTSATDVLGWATVVLDARLIQNVIRDHRGLGKTGQTLLAGPNNTTNLFRPGILGTEAAADTLVRYVLPLNATAKNRHKSHVIGSSNLPFNADQYPAIEHAMVQDVRGIDDFGSMLRTHNEMGKHVSVGYSTPPTDLVDWIVIVEQTRNEVWKPIDRLRAIILACLFGVIGFMLIISVPVAHWAVLPILRLRAATEESVEPPRKSSSGSSNAYGYFSKEGDSTLNGQPPKKKNGLIASIKSMKGVSIQRYYRKHIATHVETRVGEGQGENGRFRIPGKVKMPKHWIKDETSDLIATFNDMSDELFMQYTKLEDRVQQRTNELEHSKKAAEAANESKTLFVANVSHELKTPLNGILGMCAVFMEEDDPGKLRRALGIIHKSGDLLLRTLNDLLTFSSNQLGAQVLSLDEKEFVLRDLETQVLAIFSDQARDRKIALSCHIDESADDSPAHSTKLRDVTLFGDIHRLLQIVINLTSNALKFTPADGSVTVVMRNLFENPAQERASVMQDSTTTLGQKKHELTLVDTEQSGSACFIKPREQAHAQENTTAPPGKEIFVEFEVRDTGPGIPEDQQLRIFEPFVQGDAGLSRKHNGTGLGLSICSQLVSLMRGTIGVYSTLGEGSTFTVKVPLRQVITRSGSLKRTISAGGSRRQSSAIEPITRQSTNRSLNASPTASVTVINELEQQETAQSATVAKTPNTTLKQAVSGAAKAAKAKKDPKAGPDLSKVRVLVAEDNKVNQEVITRMLKLEQITDVTIAEDGQVALDIIRTRSAPPYLEHKPEHEHPFDIIFMDIQMPNMDGLTSTKLIRQLGFKRPIVALTAFSEQSNIDECYGAGMDYFLAKPIKRPMLKKVLTDHCTPSPPLEEKSAVSGDSTQTPAAVPSPTEEAKKDSAPSKLTGQRENRAPTLLTDVKQMKRS